MNEQDIQKALKDYFNHLYVLTNSYIFGWESDYFGITKGTGYCVEVEIKISKSDFKADFKNKTEKHFCFDNYEKEIISIPTKERTEYKPTGKYEIVRGFKEEIYDYFPCGYCQLVYKTNLIPNRLYYAVPDTLVDSIIDLVPKYAGLLSIGENRIIRFVKNAPLLHKQKLLKKLAPILLDKFYYQSIDRGNKILRMERDKITVDQIYSFDFEEKVYQSMIDFD